MYWRSLDEAPVSPRSNQDQDLIILLLPSRVRLAQPVLERMSCLSTVLQHSLLTRCVQSPNKQWIKHLWVPCRRSTRVFAVVRGRKRSEQHQRQKWWTPRCSMRALLPRLSTRGCRGTLKDTNTSDTGFGCSPDSVKKIVNVPAIISWIYFTAVSISQLSQLVRAQLTRRSELNICILYFPNGPHPSCEGRLF